MSTTQQMIQQNNELREQLTRDNKKYYEELLMYIRLSNWLKDNKEMEERLLEILQDIISAQEDGLSAQDYFGKEPKETADEVLSNISISWIEGWKLIGILLGASTILPLLFELSTGNQTINVLNLIINILAISIGVLICLMIIKSGLFKKRKKQSLYESVLIGLTFASAVIVLVIAPHILPDVGNIVLSDEVGLGLVTIIAVGITWKIRALPKDERLIWSGVLPIVWILFVITALNYFPVTSSWIETVMGKTTAGIIGLLLGVAANYLIVFYAMKREKHARGGDKK